MGVLLCCWACAGAGAAGVTLVPLVDEAESGVVDDTIARSELVAVESGDPPREAGADPTTKETLASQPF